MFAAVWPTQRPRKAGNRASGPRSSWSIETSRELTAGLDSSVTSGFTTSEYPVQCPVLPDSEPDIDPDSEADTEPDTDEPMAASVRGLWPSTTQTPSVTTVGVLRYCRGEPGELLHGTAQSVSTAGVAVRLNESPTDSP